MEFTNELYLENERLIKKMVANVARKHGLEAEELLGDAFEIAVKAANKFDETKGAKFSTWLQWQLQQLHSYAFKVKGIPQLKYKIENNIEYGIEERVPTTLNKPFYPVVDYNGDDLDNEGNSLLFEEAIGNIDFSYQKTELLNDIATSLSTNSQLYLKDLLQGYYQEPISKKGGRPSKFPMDKICNRYNWSRKEATLVRQEITTWWNNYGMVA